MKPMTLIIACSISTSCSFGQDEEFKIYPNGLMYSDSTMTQLEFIVDSLNLKFRTCDLSKTYYSKYQARANYIMLDRGNIKAAREDMEHKISYLDFIKKYSTSKAETELLVIKYKYRNYREEDVIEYRSLPDEYRVNTADKDGIYESLQKGTWVFDHSKKSKYSDESITGFFFTSEFEKSPIADYYARMILYSDCMVDTNNTLYKESAVETGRWQKEKENDKVKKLLWYIHSVTRKPVYDKSDHKAYWDQLKIWNERRIGIIDTFIVKEAHFQKLLSDAINSALAEGGSNDELELYAERYYSKKAALELKRSRIVVGGCSMDQAPRIHALEIAVLSAETVNWETFLRSHLDILNDNFSRSSDGSYAWGGRKTYIRELEKLDINVTDLLLGITLRLENPSQNHYFGSIRRLGRALSESSHSKEVESKMLEMIASDSLDDYNRLLIYYLFLNYNHHMDDESRKKDNVVNLKKAVMRLPEYLALRIKPED
jgi:hypothetical protein